MGLVDSLVGVWLPGFVGAISVLIMRAAFLAVPRERVRTTAYDAAQPLLISQKRNTVEASRQYSRP